MAWAVVAALGGAPADGGLASGLVHGAPMGPPAGVEQAAAPAVPPVRSPQASPVPAASEPPVSAQGALKPDVKALVDRVQAFYEKTQDFTARFRQDYSY